MHIEGKRGVVVEGGPGWVPSEEVLIRLERCFPERLGADAERGRRVDGYFRQYWGQVIEGGERIVEVELFRKPPVGIEYQPVMIFDGVGHVTTWYHPDRDVCEGLMGSP